MNTARYRPHSLRIMGREYSVDYDDILDQEMNFLGCCTNSEAEILIKDGQIPVEEADTLIHETLHALFYLLDFELSMKKEEAIVRPLATGILQVFLDNPGFLKYLLKVANSQRE